MPDRNTDSSGTPRTPHTDEPSAAPPCRPDTDLVELLSSKVVGQPDALRFIVPYIQMYQAGLAPAGRPVGVFLLLGPTGTGKTRTVEALAEVLHGSEKAVVKVDCGEFQADHEVAKLIGAPPGYLGHRETRPQLSAQRLAEVTSTNCGLSLVLFDEIEKAAPALSVLLLGILDKAQLRLGDGTTVDFERSLIFLTSNLGARAMLKALGPRIGFEAAPTPDDPSLVERLESIGLAAVRRRFSPEFVNRLDAVITYRPLDDDALLAIVDQHLDELRRHVYTRLGARSFELAVATEVRRFLVDRGTSVEYGAREMRRTLHRYLVQPLAGLVATGRIAPGCVVQVAVDEGGEALRFEAGERPAADSDATPAVLVVDDNRDLLGWFESTLEAAGYTVRTASTVAEARAIAERFGTDAAVLDFILPDGDGVGLGVELFQAHPGLPVVLMSGTELPAEEAAVCRRYDFPTIVKPFLGDDLVRLIEARLLHSRAAAGPRGSGRA